MTTDCFLACLRRFVSRCGLPTEINSDNGSNFKGAKHDLYDLLQVPTDSLHSRVHPTVFTQQSNPVALHSREGSALRRSLGGSHQVRQDAPQGCHWQASPRLREIYNNSSTSRVMPQQPTTCCPNQSPRRWYISHHSRTLPHQKAPYGVSGGNNRTTHLAPTQVESVPTCYEALLEAVVNR